jgi:hypothetical protein
MGHVTAWYVHFLAPGISTISVQIDLVTILPYEH